MSSPFLEIISLVNFHLNEPIVLFIKWGAALSCRDKSPPDQYYFRSHKFYCHSTVSINIDSFNRRRHMAGIVFRTQINILQLLIRNIEKECKSCISFILTRNTNHLSLWNWVLLGNVINMQVQYRWFQQGVPIIFINDTL